MNTIISHPQFAPLRAHSRSAVACSLKSAAFFKAFRFPLSSFALPSILSKFASLRAHSRSAVACSLRSAAFFLSALCLSVSAQTWLLDGRQSIHLEITDPQAARLDGSNITDPTGFRTAIAAASLADLPPAGRSITVPVGADPVANGTSLLAAYDTAKAMTPTASNQVAVLLPPAIYDLGQGTLLIDTDHIHLRGTVPVTLTTLGAVPVEIGDTTAYGHSAVLTGHAPYTTLISTGTAISNTAHAASVAFVKIEGAVFTAGDKAALWQDVWFAGPVDTQSATSNTFIRIYAPAGLCGDPDETENGNNHFRGHLVQSIVQGFGSLGGYMGTATGTFIRNTITGDYTLGGAGTLHARLIGNTITGSHAVGGGGSVQGTFIDNLVVGTACFGGEDGTLNATLIRNTVHGDHSLGSGGTVDGEYTGNTFSGQACLGGAMGTVNGHFHHNRITGPGAMTPGTITSNALFAYTTGIPAAVTNTTARVLYSTDPDGNPIPNQ